MHDPLLKGVFLHFLRNTRARGGFQNAQEIHVSETKGFIA
jgi:hypothetical protein